MEIIRAIFIGAIPTLIITFAMVFFALRRGYIETGESLASLKKKRKQAKKEKQDFKVNPIHSKWLYFGGGYYGLMALSTYIHVEFIEVYDFFAAYTSFADLLDKISFGALIKLVIESFLNLIPAFTWFLYWPKVIIMHNGWYWLAASYGGYYVGEILGRYFIERQIDSSEEI